MAIAEFKVWKNIRRGNHTSCETSKRILEAAGCRVSEWSYDILKRVDFTAGLEELDLVVVSYAELGYPSGATRQQTYKRAFELGLAKVPGWVGPALREGYMDQPMGEWILIGMDPIADSGGYVDVFMVERSAHDLLLNIRNGRPDYFWSGYNRWVFALRK